MKQTEAKINALLERIIQQLRDGVEPWKPRWDSVDGRSLPYNFSTNSDYHGLNILSLLSESLDKCYSSNAWLTFKQASLLDGKVRKGEKATWAFYYQLVPKDPSLDADDKDQTFYAMRKPFPLYNVEQIDGIELPSSNEFTDFHKSNDSTVNAVHKLTDTYFERESIEIVHKGNHAFYSPSKDMIAVPRTFLNSEGYASTLLHEMVHSTGHKERLNRFDPLNHSGFNGKDEAYAYEELVAAIGESFLCGQLGVNNMETSHVSYIDFWLEHLDDNPKALLKAASDASKAVNYIYDEKPSEISSK